MANNGVKARQNTQTNNQVFVESADARAMPCHSRVYYRKPAVHPARPGARANEKWRKSSFNLLISQNCQCASNTAHSVAYHRLSRLGLTQSDTVSMV